MHAKWLVALLGGLALGAVITIATWHPGQAQEAKKAGDPGARLTPPDIKVGDRVQFQSSVVNTMVTIDERAPKVAKIQGNWLFLEGEVRNQAYNIKSGWVNFDNVEWYRIVADK